MSERLQVRRDVHPSIQTFVDINTIMRDVTYDPTDLNDGFVDHMPLVVYYNELLARAEHQASLSKDSLNLTEASVIKDLRAIHEAKGNKVAENRLEKEVLLDPRFIDAQTRYRDAKYVQTLIQGVVTAMEHRRSMILQQARQNMQQTVPTV